MQNILLLGAGRTAHFLVEYLLNQASENNWKLRVGDFLQSNLDMLPENESFFSKVIFNVNNQEQLLAEVQKVDIVISLLPAHFHIIVAKVCLQEGKHFLSASYVSDDFKTIETEIKAKGLLFLKELGLDPGIDHMSAMRMLDDIRSKGGKIKSFKSYTGGLMAPDNKENPWEYKFTWNPAYVVTAGRDGGIYLKDNKIKRIPYQRLFKEIDVLDMPGYGSFDAYYNRNSLKYIDEYGLNNVETVIRYTLRRQGFCKAWAPLVTLGLTDNLFEFSFNEPVSRREYLEMFIRESEGALEERFSRTIGYATDSEVFVKLAWLGLFSHEKLPITSGTAAKMLEQILLDKWQMQAHEKDAIYMAHVCYYMLNNELFKRKCYLAVEGQNQNETAMAKTVGLPLAIAAELILKGQLSLKGLHIPTLKSIYTPVLQKLEQQNIGFHEIEEKQA